MHLLSTKTWLFLFCTKLVGQSNSFGIYECAEFRGSPVIVGLVDLVPSSIVSLWVFCGTKIFSHGYFVDEIFFVVEISWVQNIYRGYLVGPKLSLVVISWFKSFFSWVLCGFKTFSRGYFIGPNFSLSWLISWFKDFQLLVGWERVSNRKRKYINTCQTVYSFSNWFQQFSVLFILGPSSTKLVMLLRSFH